MIFVAAAQRGDYSHITRRPSSLVVARERTTTSTTTTTLDDGRHENQIDVAAAAAVRPIMRSGNDLQGFLLCVCVCVLFARPCGRWLLPLRSYIVHPRIPHRTASHADRAPAQVSTVDAGRHTGKEICIALFNDTQCARAHSRGVSKVY